MVGRMLKKIIFGNDFEIVDETGKLVVDDKNPITRVHQEGQKLFQDLHEGRRFEWIQPLHFIIPLHKTLFMFRKRGENSQIRQFTERRRCGKVQRS